jgi:hypothetical protein
LARSIRFAQSVWILPLILLPLASIACQLDVGGPQSPWPPIAPSADAAGDMANEWQSAFAAAANSGQVTLLLDESQLTSFLTGKLDSRTDPVIEQPQVYLRDDSLQIFGRTRQGPLLANIRIILQPELDAKGGLAFKVVSADFGPFPAPAAMKSGLSGLITETLSGTLGSLATGIHITTVAIADGQMAIVGDVR